jgi:hypothetical protein
MSENLHPTLANGRQYELSIVIPIGFENVGPDLTELPLSTIEAGAIVTHASIAVITAFNIGTATIELGATVLVPATSLTSVDTTSTDLGATNILLDTPLEVPAGADLKTSIVAATDATSGKAVITVKYLVPYRVNEVNA